MKRLLFLAVLAAFGGLASCGYAPPSTAVTCTTNTSTSSSTTSTSTCTDPVTNISVTISPATVSVNVVSAQQFQDAIQGGTNNVAIWKVNSITGGNDAVGRIDSNGLYHAPSVVPPPPSTVSVSVTSFEDQLVTATSTVTITAAPTVQISSPAPASCTSSSSTPPACITAATAGNANTITFTGTETGGSANVVLWSVGTVGGLGILGGNATLGTINANGVYSPPVTPPIGQTVVVSAAAQDAPASIAALTVKISGYSTSSLLGRFAFSLSGINNTSGHFFRAGSFTADGSGHLSSVLEDTNSASGATTAPMVTTGTYTVGTDGRGTLQFSDGLTPANFNFVLVNGTQLQIIGFDGSGTASGQANSQDASTFLNTPLLALNGNFVFDFSGVHGSNGLSEIGEFGADGAGNITGGSVDINDGGSVDANDATPPVPFQINASNTACVPNPLPAPQPPSTPLSTYTIASNGRGVLTLNTIQPTGPNKCFPGPALTLNFYVVSRGGAKFVGTDTALQVAGFTSQQSPNATLDVTALNGNYALLLAGTAPGGPIATAGNFLADGNGHFTSGVLDENVNGTPSANQAFQLSGTIAGTYSVASNGRGTLSYIANSRTYNLVFYLGRVGSNTTAVLQEIDSSIASDGNFTQQQSAPFTLASIAGTYAIETSGDAGGSPQVLAGQLATDGAGGTASAPPSAVDVNTGGTLVPALAVTGLYLAPAPNGRTSFGLTPVSSNYAAYVVNSNTVYLLDLQSGQLAAGTLLRQF